MTKERDTSIDVACGIMIIWMIFYHSMQFSGMIGTVFFETSTQIFFFFMAWFFYKGGIFAKTQPFVRTVLGGANRLLKPFAVFSAFGLIVYWIELLACNDFLLNSGLIIPLKSFFAYGAVQGNLPLWFLWSLFLVRIYYCCGIKWRWFPELLFMLLIVFYFIKFLDLFELGHCLLKPLYLYNSFVGLIFFYCGYRLKCLQYNKRVILLSIAILMAILFFAPARFDIHNVTVVERQKGDFLLFIISATSACVLLNALCRYICGKCDFGILSYIGENSLSLFCIHWILLVIVRDLIVCHLDIGEGWPKMVVYCLSLLLLLPLCLTLMKRLNINY